MASTEGPPRRGLHGGASTEWPGGCKEGGRVAPLASCGPAATMRAAAVKVSALGRVLVPLGVLLVGVLAAVVMSRVSWYINQRNQPTNQPTNHSD